MIVGTRPFGKVDVAKDQFYIATMFVHAFYIPIVPQGSLVVTSQDRDGWSGTHIGWSVKSIATAYLRVVLVILAILGWWSGLNGLGTPAYLVGCIAVLALLITYGAPGWGIATYEQACRIADRIDLGKDSRIALKQAYGKITKAEIQAMEDAEQDAIALGRR